MKYFIIFCLLIFLLVTLYIDIFKYFIGPDFRSGLAIVPIVLMANLLLGIFYNLSVWYKLTDKTKFGAMIAFLGAIITILLNVLLVPKYGYTGAAWAHLACYFTMVVLSFVGSRKFYKISYDLRNIFFYFINAFGLYFLSVYFPLEEGMVKYAVHLLYMIIFLILAVLLERNKYKAEFK